MAYRLAARGELVPELGSVNGVPARGLGYDWTTLLDNIGQAVEIGGAVYDKYIDPDSQNAALELAKLNAQTAAERTRALALQQTAAQRAATGASGAPSTGLLGGLSIGVIALVAGGGLLAWKLLGRRGRK